MDGTEDDTLYEDFFGEDVAETEDVADNDGNDDYYDYDWGQLLRG